jgi:hypothetical protein
MDYPEVVETPVCKTNIRMLMPPRGKAVRKVVTYPLLFALTYGGEFAMLHVSTFNRTRLDYKVFITEGLANREAFRLNQLFDTDQFGYVPLTPGRPLPARQPQNKRKHPYVHRGNPDPLMGPVTYAKKESQ